LVFAVLAGFPGEKANHALYGFREFGGIWQGFEYLSLLPLEKTDDCP